MRWFLDNHIKASNEDILRKLGQLMIERGLKFLFNLGILGLSGAPKEVCQKFKDEVGEIVRNFVAQIEQQTFSEANLLSIGRAMLIALFRLSDYAHKTNAQYFKERVWDEIGETIAMVAEKMGISTDDITKWRSDCIALLSKSSE